jgi:NAD(P)H-hydrate repair Nnr-like enzyme with NAD(P)H-hydrate epimerase domain
MIKILSVDQIKQLDARTIAHEPIASIDLMERASHSFVNWFMQRFDNTWFSHSSYVKRLALQSFGLDRSWINKRDK